MPPFFKNGIYAEYNAAFSLIAKDNTEGRAGAGVFRRRPQRRHADRAGFEGGDRAAVLGDVVPALPV